MIPNITFNSHRRLLPMCHCWLEVIIAASPLLFTVQHWGRARKQRAGRSGPASRTCWQVQAEVAGRSIIHGARHRGPRWHATANLPSLPVPSWCLRTVRTHTDTFAALKGVKLRTDKCQLTHHLVTTAGGHACRAHGLQSSDRSM